MDIDIDFKNRDDILRLLPHVTASRIVDDNIVKHNVGVYFQDMPVDPISGLATIDYEEAEQMGYFKIDFLNLNVYEKVRSPEHLDHLVEQEPIWELLEEKLVVQNLFHLHNHYDIVSKMKPRTVEQLAAVLAMIRPAKKHLIGKSWDKVFEDIWVEPEDPNAYHFKKAHSFSYAMVVVVQLNLLTEELLQVKDETEQMKLAS